MTRSVSNLEVSFEFYTKILGFQPIVKWKRGAYLLARSPLTCITSTSIAGDLWLCLSLDKNTPRSTLKEYTHIAFTVSSENLQQYRNYLKSNLIQEWQENTSEGESLYIAFLNGHKLELHSKYLRARITAIKKVQYQGMELFPRENEQESK